MIKRLCEAGQQVAHREKRSTVQHKDIGKIIGAVIPSISALINDWVLATVVRKADEFLFLEGVFSVVILISIIMLISIGQKLCRGPLRNLR